MKKALKIIIPIVIVLAILAALGGTIAFLWFKTDLFNRFKPSDKVFADQVKEAFDLKDVKFTEYSDILNKYRNLSDKSMKTKLNVTANLNISQLDKEVQNTINKSKLTIEANTDAKNKNMQSKIGLYSNNSEVLTVDMVKNGNKLGVGCKDIYDKYLIVSTDDLIEYLKKDGSIDATELDAVSKVLSGDGINVYDLLYISEDDLKHFDDTYSVDKILDLISKDCYSKDNKKQEVEVDGETVKALGSYLTLTGADAYKLAEDLVNKIKDDSVISKIMTEKANMVLEYAGQDKISENDMKEILNDSFDQLLKEMSSIKDENEAAVQIAIYSKNNKPVRIEFNALKDVDDKDDKETLLSIEYADKKDIYTVYNNGKAYITVENEYEKKDKNEYKGKLTAKASGVSVGTLDYEIIIKDDESKIYLDLSVPMANLSGKVDITSKGNINNEAVTLNGLVSFKYGRESAEVKFDGSVEVTDVTIPELNTSNSLNILSLTDAESAAEAEKILKKASEVLPARLKLLGINIDANSIYTPTATTTDDADNTTVTVPTTLPNGIDQQTAIDNAKKTLDAIDRSQQLINSMNR